MPTVRNLTNSRRNSYTKNLSYVPRIHLLTTVYLKVNI
nr:MAG TPA: hypothetical protein [Caudoviricetes sp.]